MTTANDEMLTATAKGFLGLAFSVAGTAVTYADTIEQWLRIAGSAGAVLVTLLTAISLIKGWRKKKRTRAADEEWIRPVNVSEIERDD